MATSWLWFGVVRLVFSSICRPWLTWFLLGFQGVRGWNLFFFVTWNEDGLVAFPPWCGKNLSSNGVAVVDFRLVGRATSRVPCGGTFESGLIVFRLGPNSMFRSAC